MPVARRESVDVTALLRNILDNYPAGSAVIREFLQNTDDSGATIQTFILDTRTSSSDALVDLSLASCQGPAIIAANDGYFLDKDWTAITRIHTSSKKSDETSTGKYGLGFRSSYHVTDNPQILSGQKLLVLDPHQRVEKYPGGFELSTNNDDRKKYHDHFDAFNAVLTPNATSYEGTAIRLPLRVDASKSNIKSTGTDVNVARQMFMDFMTKDLEECMLFLKHITKVELIEIAPDGSRINLGSSWIDNAEVVGPLRKIDRGRNAETSHYPLTVNVKVGENTSTSRWIVTQFVEEYSVARDHLKKRLYYSAMPMGIDMTTEKLLPHIALAYPITERNSSSSPFAGRLFTLLPLPIFTKFPLHINAVLALTSSRQNLRSAPDAIMGSREEFLVQWNNVVFTELVPKAWAAMLKHIITLPGAIDLFAAWPQSAASVEGDRIYWQPLPGRLLEEAGPMEVWPVQLGSPQNPLVHRKLLDVLVSSPSSSALIRTLKICGVPIITPPPSVHGLIQQSTLYRSQLLRPSAVHPFLRENVPSFSTLDAAAVKSITEYLTTSGEINLLYDLPLFLNCNGGYTTMLSNGTYIFATEKEVSMFQGADPDLLKFDVVSPKTQALLRRAHDDRIRTVKGNDVARYLIQLFNHLQSQTPTISSGVKPEDSAWLVTFWNWVGNRMAGSSLFTRAVAETLYGLYLIPLDAPETEPRLCRLSRGVLDGRPLTSGVREVLRNLGVPILHPGVSIGGQNQNLLTKQEHAIFILENIASPTSLDRNATRTFNKFLTDRLSTFHRSGKALTPDQQTTLRTLPIFPLLSPGPRPRSSQNSEQTFGPASEASMFVGDSVHVIPSIGGRSFVDGREGAILAQVLNQATVGEMAVLRLVLEPTKWTEQANVEGLSDLLVDRVVHRMSDFGPEAQKQIAEIPIVDVGPHQPRMKPSRVIDPKSKLNLLYDADDGVVPHGRFAEDGPGTLLQQFRGSGMLRSKIDEATIIEVITKLGDDSKDFPQREDKALVLLPLLSKHAASNPMSSALKSIIQTQKWLPANGEMHRPAECWDIRRSDADFCDFVLPLVPRVVQSLSLRDTLGWRTVPSIVLQAQLIAVVKEKPQYPLPDESQDHPSKRIISILRELSTRFKAKTITTEVLKRVVDALGDLPWVPVTLESCLRPHQTMLSGIEIGTRFHRVHPDLAEKANSVNMLKAMGICDRPSPSALRTELESIAFDLTQSTLDGQSKSDSANESVAILHEISRRPLEFNLEHALILDDKQVLRPISAIIFNDRGLEGVEPPSGLFFAHPSISLSLALDLGLLQLSKVELDQNEDQMETFHMVEELSTRVRNTLKGYDVEYASNEWVANADDAKASTIKFILDEGTFGDSTLTLLGDEMMQFQKVTSLVIYNDSVFTEKDFKGIGSIGLGGKLLMIVSASSVLFLDPSQSYLPPKNGELRRTGIKMSLSWCRSHFPGQLKPLDGLCGFDSSMDHYKGTLFRLPLRAASQTKQSKLSKESFTALRMSEILLRYSPASTQSMFFSRIQNISALRRNPDGDMSTLWSVDGSRHPYGVEKDGMRVDLEIIDSNGGKRKEQWLVCVWRHEETDFPETFQPLFAQHRLPPPITGIALNTSSEGQTSRELNYRLFATLPLPVSISLPAHVHATWILSEDRRSLRYDLEDGSGQRPLDAKYNEYILQSLIPPLYLRALAILTFRTPREADKCWPRQPTDPVSLMVTSALYTQLKVTKERVLRTAAYTTIAPKDALLHVNGPPAIGRIMTALNLPNFVRWLPFNASLVKEWDTLRTDNPREVARLLQDSAKDIRKLYKSDPSNAADIDTVINYLLTAGVDLNGVPLLQLSDLQITTFKPPSEPTVFCSAHPDIASIFGGDKIIGPHITRKTVETLCSLKLNVRKLDVEGLRELLRRCPMQVVSRPEAAIAIEDRPWYDTFLTFLASPASPVKLEELANLPLIPCSHAEVAFSLDRAREPGVWWKLDNDEEITPVLQQCAIPIIQFPKSDSLRKHVTSLVRVLGVLESPGIHQQLARHEVVSTPEWAAFAEWIKLRLTPSEVQVLNYTQVQTLGQLPLFSGQQGRAFMEFASASNISMLPLQVDSTDFARFLPGHIIISPFSSPLHATLVRLAPTRILSISALIGQLNLPRTLPPDQQDALKSVINIICQNPQELYASPFVPNENSNLCMPSTLYDGDVPVFRQSFAGRPDMFVHPNFHDVVDRLVPLGVHRVVTPADIVSCARVIDQDTRAGLADTRARAESLWSFINQELTDTRRLDFNTISGLRFIPSHPQRHLWEPALSHHAPALPDVLSMNQLCLREHAPTVWTQRAIFDEAPSVFTMAISQKLGVPTVQELVEHLVTLATVVAIEHPGNRLLFSDIQHTYLAIQNQAAAATMLLLRHKHQRIWLNVDDSSEDWVWRSAAELVFDLRYDGTEYYDVKGLLEPHRAMLLTVGAKEYRYETLNLPNQVRSGKSSHAQQFLAGWQKLREAGDLIDIQFDIGGRFIKAHRGVLAAVAPHFITAFTGGFRESQSIPGTDNEIPVYPLPMDVSLFAVQAVVDYAYTGKFTDPSPETIEESGVALDDLLDLLNLANFWGLEELKLQTAQTLVKLQLVRTETCDDILEMAERCNAHELVDVCRKTKLNNPWI